MTIARKRQICLEETPFYHCICRCVRRAYLCGMDRFSGKSYEHRRGWVEDKLILLSKAFCIDIVSYAIMSNHYHVVLKVDVNRAKTLSDHDVIDRWGLLYRVSPLVGRFRHGECLSKSELVLVMDDVQRWRDHLTNISKYMGYINERIAREANQEDECKGRFWEGRFTSQALLDDNALLRCMTYVDLNPIRAGIASTPEQSEYTSIKRRLDIDYHGLIPFLEPAQSTSNETDCALPFNFVDYLELVDWAGRIIRDDKSGAIPNQYPPLLERLEKHPEKWIRVMKTKPKRISRALGSAESIKSYCHAIGQKWLWQPPAFNTS